MIARFTLSVLATLLALAPHPAAARTHWTRAWTASLWQPNERDVLTVDGQTLRLRVRVNAGGPAIRIWLGNDFGRVPLAIGRAVARTADGRSAPLTFAGRADARIAPGAPLVSDPVTLAVKRFDMIELSVFLPGKQILIGMHDARGDPVEVSGPGDFTATTDWPSPTRRALRPLVAGIDVTGEQPRPVVVAFGDSITDVGDCAIAAPEPCRWSDVLARRLAAAGKPHVVINQGIGGNRILTAGAGAPALARFDRDVLAVPGVSHLLLLEGINDIGTSGDSGITAEQLIAGYRQLTLRAQDKGIKVIALTVLPFEGAGYHRPERETIRVSLNQWIRTAGIFDQVVDLERTVADPANPKRLRSDLQSGDNLHPNAAGQRAMGAAIPLSLFR